MRREVVKMLIDGSIDVVAASAFWWWAGWRGVVVYGVGNVIGYAQRMSSERAER
jgi:hypothetical protein